MRGKKNLQRSESFVVGTFKSAGVVNVGYSTKKHILKMCTAKIAPDKRITVIEKSGNTRRYPVS